MSMSVRGAWLVAAAALITACSKDPEVAKVEYYKSAQELAKKGEVPQAILEYRNAIQQDAKYGEARLELGRLLLQKGELAAARQEFIRAADILVKSPEAQLMAGEIHLAARQYEDAATRARKALALDPKSVRAQLLKGNALAGLRQFDDAIKEIENAIALDPSQSASYGNLGVVQFALGRSPEAEASLKRAVEVAPAQVEPRIALASFYLMTRQVALAENTLTAALQSSPRDANLNRAMATMFLVTGRAGQAEAPLKIVVEEKHDLRSQLTLADYYRGMHRDDEALKLLASVAGGKEKEGFSPAMIRKATILRQQGKHDPAYAALDEALARDAHDADTLVLKAMFLADDGKLGAALATVEAAVKAKPSAASVQFALGRVQQLRGVVPAATTAYLESLKLFPENAEALRRLSELALSDLHAEEAMKYAQDALSLRPDFPEAQMLLARAQTIRGDFTAAEGALQTLGKQFPQSASVQAQLGTVSLVRNDIRAARASYEKALSIDPTSQEAIAGLVQIDLRGGQKAAALARADAALAKSPNSAALMVVAAQPHLATGDIARAETLLRSAIEIDPSRLVAYGMLVQIYASQNRLDAAIVELERVAQQRSDLVGAPTLIGMLLEQQNKTAEAQARYEAIVRKYKSAAIAANNLAWIYVENRGDLDTALELAQTAKAGLPESAEVSDTIGWIYYKKKLFPQAVVSLKDAATRSPSNVLMQYHLGLACVSASEYKLAKSVLAAALKAEPNAPLAGDARAALNLISNIGL